MSSRLRLLIVIFAFTVVQQLAAQCPTGSVNLDGQAAVDAFGVDYPNCSVINGNLTITGNPTDLTALSNLTTVTGKLHIQSALGPLAGLEGITSVKGLIIGSTFPAGGMQVWSENLAPLGNISGALDTLYLHNTGAGFTSLGTDFPGVTSVKSLSISSYFYHTAPVFPALTFVREWRVSNTSLTQFTLPSSLAEVSFGSEDPFDVLSSGIYIQVNEFLQTITCNASFSSVYDLNIAGNPILESINGFNNLTTVYNYFGIQGKLPTLFDSFHALEQSETAFLEFDAMGLVEPLTELFVGVGSNAPQLTLGGLAEQPYVISLNINMFMVQSIVWPAALISATGDINVSATAANAVQAFGQLSSVGGNFSINAPELNQLPQMLMLQNVGGDLIFSNGQAGNLLNFQGLNTLESVGGNFSFGRSIAPPTPYALQSLQGLESLTEVGGSFTLRNLADLSDMSALSNLSSVGGQLRLNNLPLLTTQGFNLSSLGSTEGLLIEQTGLESIPAMPQFASTGGITLRNNPELLNTAGFESLQIVNGDITIDNNPLLTEVNFDLDLTYSGAFTLTGNTSLAECGTPVVCKLVDLSSSDDISNNAPGCESLKEVQAACALSVEYTPLSSFSSYQSGHNTLVLQAERDLGPVTLTLCDLQGRTLLQKTMALPSGKTIISLPTHASGVYVLQVNAAGESGIVKVPLF